MKHVRVVAALLERPGPAGPVYLAQQRPPGGARGLLWEFPGGKVEPGEGDGQALIRELREELGCEVEVGEKVAEVEHRYPDLALDLALYRCTLRSGEPRALHAVALLWETAERLAQLPFTEADVPFLAGLGRAGNGGSG